MNTTCPQCNFSKTVDPARLPDRPIRVNCPKGSSSFSFEKPAGAGQGAGATRPEQVACPACGLAQEKSESCAGCGVVYAKWQSRMQPDQEDMAKADAEQSYVRQIICNSCGTVQPPRSHCRHCGAAIVAIAGKAESEYAGFWIRVVATLLDSVLLGIVQFFLTFIITRTIGLMGIAATEDPAVSFIIWLFGTTISLGYAVFFIGYCGQTPGKMALRIRVVCTDGSQPTYGRAAKREVLGKFVSSILLGIGYLMVAFDNRKQGLHDKIADTYVIKT